MPTTGAVIFLIVLAGGTGITVAVAFLFLYRSARRRDTAKWELGVSYLVKERGSNRGLSLFNRLIEITGNKGMVIARTFPKKLQANEGLEDIPIWWLSREESPESIDPLSLAKLAHVIRDFIQKEEQAVVLLDGLEYLIMQNNFETTLRFIQGLNDLIILNKATLIVPVDPSSLSVKQLSLLEKEMETHRLSMNILRFFGE
jgi:two-component system cell cycle response regulator